MRIFARGIANFGFFPVDSLGGFFAMCLPKWTELKQEGQSQARVGGIAENAKVVEIRV